MLLQTTAYPIERVTVEVDRGGTVAEKTLSRLVNRPQRSIAQLNFEDLPEPL